MNLFMPNKTDAAGIRIKRGLLNIVKYGTLLFLLFIFIAPLYWMVATSLKVGADIQAWPPQWIPHEITLDSYKQAISVIPFGRLFFNSIVIGVITVVGNVFGCTMASYTLVRKKFKGKNIVFLLIVSSMMLPTHIRLIPLYLMCLKLNLVNTYLGIALPTLVTGFGVFMMRQFIMGMPKEVEDAARVDGLSEWGILWKIVLPMCCPAVISLSIFAFTWSFEDFLWPLIVTSESTMRPLPVGITLFQGLVVYEWGPVMAMATLTILPVLVVYLLLQKYFVTGMTAGAVKG